MPQLPQKPRPNKIAKTNRVIDIIDYLAAIQTQSNGEFGINEGLWPNTYFAFHGVIANNPPTGSSDFTDNRYWVKLARPTPRGTTPTGNDGFYMKSVGPASNSTTHPTFFVATNVGEPNFESGYTNSHSVDKGTPVQVYCTLMAKPTGYAPMLKYWFNLDRFNLFPVSLTVTPGGTDGTQLAAPNYTYTVKSLLETRVIGENVEVLGGRPPGAINPAVRGSGYFDAGTGVFILYDAKETYETAPCGS